MANDFFNHDANRIAQGVRALSSQVNNIADEIATGLDKMPTEAQIKQGKINYAVDTGAANAYVVAMPYAPAAYTDGLEVQLKVTNANTGPSTLNVDSLGPISIRFANGSELDADAFTDGQIATVRYNATTSFFHMTSQATSQLTAAQGAATAAQVAQGLAEDAQAAAETAETNSETAQGLAETAQTASEAALDSFTDLYLGAKTADPTLDNDNNPLQDGAIYWRITIAPTGLHVYDLGTTTWQFYNPSGNPAGAVLETDTSTANMDFVVDDDTFAGASDTTISTSQAIKAYVDNAVASDVTYQGSYDAATNTPDLDTSPSGITNGDMYSVTVAGTFFTAPVSPGDTLIAAQDNPTAEAHWSIIDSSADAATTKAQYESNADTNVFDDAAQTKLGTIESNATADQTAGEIKTAYEGNSDTNAFQDAEKTKLGTVATSANNYSHPNHTGDVTSTGDGAQAIVANAVTNAKAANMATATLKGRTAAGTGDPQDLTAAQARAILNVENGATADQSNSEIKTAYEANSNTNALTDPLLSKLNGVEAGAEVNNSFRGCLAYRTDNVTIGNGALYTLELNLESYDTDTIHSTTVDPENFVVPSGVTKIRMTISWQLLVVPVQTGYLRTILFLEGVSAFPGESYNTTACNDNSPVYHTSTSHIIKVTAGDILHVQMLNATGVSTTLLDCAVSMEIIE